MGLRIIEGYCLCGAISCRKKVFPYEWIYYREHGAGQNGDQCWCSQQCRQQVEGIFSKSTDGSP